MSGKTVLVTGCAGYIGSVLTPYLLEQGYKVVGVDSLMYTNGRALLGVLGHPNFTFVNRHVDHEWHAVMNYVRTSDVVIPLAAIVGAPACDERPGQATITNHYAIRELVPLLNKYQLLIYPNTNSGYGSTDGSRACVEDDPLLPVSIYGKTKCDGEAAALTHPNSIIFRLATVFGASPRMRMDLMVNDFVFRLFRKHELSIFEPHFKRNFVHVRDVARAFLYGMTSWRMRRGVYNLGLPSANMTKMELAHTIASQLGLSKLAVTEGSGKDPDQRNYLVSNDKVLGTGFEFKHSLESGIDEVITVCRTHSFEELANMRNA